MTEVWAAYPFRGEFSLPDKRLYIHFCLLTGHPDVLLRERSTIRLLSSPVEMTEALTTTRVDGVYVTVSRCQPLLMPPVTTFTLWLRASSVPVLESSRAR